MTAPRVWNKAGLEEPASVISYKIIFQAERFAYSYCPA